MRLPVCLLVLWAAVGVSPVLLVALWFTAAAVWHNHPVRTRRAAARPRRVRS